jgi:hypothetical protein
MRVENQPKIWVWEVRLCPETSTKHSVQAFHRCTSLRLSLVPSCSRAFVFLLFTKSLSIFLQFDISTDLKIPSETFIKYANTEMLPFLYSQTERINKALRGMLKGIADRIQIFDKLNISRSRTATGFWTVKMSLLWAILIVIIHAIKVKSTGAA